MRENSELEEGEMNCSTSEGFVDLDIDLSYIDKKVQNVLGHLQKDYGGGAQDLFGPKICDYGSFLPNYKHSPAVPSCQKSSLGNHAVQRFSNNVPGKNVVQKFQSLPTTPCKLVSNQNPQNCQTSGSLSAQAPGKVPIKNANARIPGNDSYDHKPIRVRIKMGSEILSRKVTMVCNDLGLDDSPNSPPRISRGNSSITLPRPALDKTSVSPSRILREMTAIPVPQHLLMSPLPDSLLLVKDKEKKHTLLDNEPVLKAGKVPSIRTQSKFSDVLDCVETPIRRRRKAADCFDATTWNETSSIGEMKKQKVFPTVQLPRENSIIGLGGASSTNDGFTTKSNLKKGMKRDGESDPKVAFAKSNKVKVVGKHAEKETKTYPTKLVHNSSKNRFDDKILSKMPFKDAACMSQSSMDIGLDFAAASSSTSLDLDNWAQCDGCETWRLLPFGLKPEQLPDKWLCSMQTWLPGMNHCGISEEETTNAIKSFHCTEAHGPETGVKFLVDASNADKSDQPLNSSSLPNPTEKKSTVKDLSQGVSSNILVDAAKPMRSNSQVFRIKNMKPLETPNATQISTDLGVSRAKIDQKAEWPSAGTGSQIKIKKKKEESEGSKKIKTSDGNKLCRDVKSEEIHWKQDLEWNPEERKTKRHDDNFYTSDVERDTKKRLLTSKKKPDHRPQVTTGSGTLCTKFHGRSNSPVRKIRLMGYKKGNNENNSKLLGDGEEKEPSIEKVTTSKISVQEMEAHQRDELFQAEGSREHQNGGGSRQISGVETSSSSKVYGSHQIGRKYVEEVKASPVESVSSSPARSLCLKNLASAGESISRENRNLKYGDAGSRIVNNRKPLSQEAYPLGRSCQAANDILQEAEKLRKLADCFKSSGFDDEHKKTNFKAALKFLLGASVLEMRSENVERGKMCHVEAYHTAAKLSESCAHQYETSQEMAAVALAYKCTEVACMRVAYGRSLGLSGKWNELQKMIQMTPPGESPSSSASDVDSFNIQGVIDKSARANRRLSNVAGNLFPVARTEQNLVPLLDFTENMNLAMEASAKSLNAFRAATVTSEETKHGGDCVSAIKKVVDFSFHDVEAFIQMIELAMHVISSSGPGGSKR